MASPTPKPSNKRQARVQSQPRRTALPGEAPEPVDPVWLLKGFGAVVVAALICGYLSVCLLFYQGQWQLVLHPSRSAPAPSAIAGMPVQLIRFGVDESATPQLTGWWLPAEPNAVYAAYTVLYLPSGDGSLALAQPTLAAVHSLGVNLFAFDYRGYGASAAIHPNQRRMTEDAASAWQYLTVSRAIPANRIVAFGSGVGGFLAAQLAAEHPDVPAVVFDSPRPDLLDVALADPRTGSLPVRALFHERFDIAAAVKSLKTPKLFMFNDSTQKPGDAQTPGVNPAQLKFLADQASIPKVIVHLTPADRDGAVYGQQLSRFLDEYLR